MSRGDRTRTCDSLVPNQERYQLRYTSFCLQIPGGAWRIRTAVDGFADR